MFTFRGQRKGQGGEAASGVGAEQVHAGGLVHPTVEDGRTKKQKTKRQFTDRIEDAPKRMRTAEDNDGSPHACAPPRPAQSSSFALAATPY